MFTLIRKPATLSKFQHHLTNLTKVTIQGFIIVYLSYDFKLYILIFMYKRIIDIEK